MGLFSSWATPATSAPTAARLSDLISKSCVFSFSWSAFLSSWVRSSTIFSRFTFRFSMSWYALAFSMEIAHWFPRVRRSSRSSDVKRSPDFLFPRTNSPLMSPLKTMGMITVPPSLLKSSFKRDGPSQEPNHSSRLYLVASLLRSAISPIRGLDLLIDTPVMFERAPIWL